MDWNKAIEIVKGVLLDWRVIGVVIAALLYISLVNYVVKYKKKPPKIRKMKSVPAPEKQESSSEDGEASSDESQESGEGE